MNRHKTYLFALSGLLGLAGFVEAAQKPLRQASEQRRDTQDRPNIVYLMSDDQSVQSVGCYGNPEVVTPNMDKLGRDGMIFDRHYNTTAICMASRSNVLTGMYEYKTGTNFEHGHMKPAIWAKSYPLLLREAGYLTAFAGKFGFEVEGKGFECGDDFDFWGGGPGQTFYETEKNRSMMKYAAEYPHSTLSYGAFGKDVIREAVKRKKPFCLSISFKAPHRPVSPDPKFDQIYAGKTFTKPKNYGRQAGEHFSEQSKQGRQYPRFREWGYDADYDAVMAKYYQQIYAIDVALGMIRDELDSQGVANNTVIIYTSDNGFLCGAHGYGSKVLPIEESARAPLMIYDPRSASAGEKLRSPSLTGNIDFAPTILELAGLPIPECMDGVSLLPLLKDPAVDVREQLAFINVFGPPATHSLTAITKDWKYTYWWYGDAGMEPAEELFHLANDPLEMKNLAASPEASTMLKTMREKYDQELANWKSDAVPFNRYAQYGKIFDRSIPWDQKTVDNLVHGVDMMKPAVDDGGRSAPQDHYPEFSWDTIPLYMHMRKSTSFTKEELNYLAGFPLITLEKTTGSSTYGSSEDGSREAAKAIKAVNPEACVLYYRNVMCNYGTYKVNEGLKDIPGAFLQARDGNTKLHRGVREVYDLSNPALRKWWVDHCVEMAGYDEIDGLFLDGNIKALEPAFLGKEIGLERKQEVAAGYALMMKDLKDRIPPDKMLVANIIRARLSDSGLSYMQYFDGSYLEGIESPANGLTRLEYLAKGIDAVQTAARQGKIICMSMGLGRASLTGLKIDDSRKKIARGANTQPRLEYCLALFLICAEKHSYFLPHDGYSVNNNDSAVWLTRFPEYDKPLGPPKGPATQDGYTYTREFEHASVFLDIEKKQGTVTWK